MRIVVDYDLCESNAICMQVAPDIFEVRDDDFLYVLNETPPEDARARVHRSRATLPETGHQSRRRVTSGELVEVVDLDERVVEIVVTGRDAPAQSRAPRDLCRWCSTHTDRCWRISGRRGRTSGRAAGIWPFGGVCAVGEPWADAASRELAEEAGIVAPLREVSTVLLRERRDARRGAPLRDRPRWPVRVRGRRGRRSLLGVARRTRFVDEHASPVRRHVRRRVAATCSSERRNATPDSITIVGASLAGLRGAETLRNDGFDGRITVFGDETEHLRPPAAVQAVAVGQVGRRPCRALPA